jgi:hypothetical protein
LAIIAGLTLCGDEKLATGRLRVSCDAEPDGSGTREAAAEREPVRAVSTPQRELVPVG